MTSLKRKLELMDNENKRLKSDVSLKMFHNMIKKQNYYNNVIQKL